MKKRDFFDNDALMDILNSAPHPLRLDDILRMGKFSRKLKHIILDALNELATNGTLLRLQGGSWVKADVMKTLRGHLAIQRSGAAFVTPEGASVKSGQDIYIAPEYIGDAWNGDLVEILLLPIKKGSGKGPEGRVISVVERKQLNIVARVLKIDHKKHTVLCRPADPRLSFDILAETNNLPSEPEENELLSIAMGDKQKDTRHSAVWFGTVIGSLGVESDAAVQERLTKLNNSIPTEFPDNVIAEAERAAAVPDDISKLQDLRNEPLVTIDGEDARDFDDAICVQKTDHGWRLLVAIADVSHYVRPRTVLDKEAFNRGNSYYFPTSVEPMLPEVLCNGVCSLRPQEDRRCMAADMTLDKNGNLVYSHFSNGIMRSRARLTYHEVQSALDAPQSDIAADIEKRAPNICAMLMDAAELAKVLIERRRRQGSLDFDLPEAEFLIERQKGNAQVTGIKNRERLFSHRLIEAFMVRANEAVAEFLTQKKAPFLYRVHPSPGKDKLEDLYRSLRATNAELPLPKAAKAGTPKWLPHVLEAAEHTDQAFIVNRLVLRSMMQARYSPEEDGHFGLASACYCHFTSPIRRYADLVNHRVLRHALGLDSEEELLTGNKLLKTAEQCNGRERIAADAEREIGRRMGCLLLQNRIGELFEGIISGVMPFGFFVELNGMPVEGMVRVETLGHEYFIYDEDRQELRGEHSGEAFRLGQRVTVKLTDIHIGRLEINLEYKKNDEGHPSFRRSRSDRAPRRFSRTFQQEESQEEDRERHTGRHAFADRKGFRPRRNDDPRRQNRYASQNWGEDESHSEQHEERRSFRSRFSREDREHRPFRESRSFHKHQDAADEQTEHRSFRPRFKQEGNEENSFRSRFPREDKGHRPFRESRTSFRRHDDNATEENTERRPFRSRFSQNEEGESSSFRPHKAFSKTNRPFHKEKQSFRRREEYGETHFSEVSAPHWQSHREERESDHEEHRALRSRFPREEKNHRTFARHNQKEQDNRRPFREKKHDRQHSDYADRKPTHHRRDDFFAITTEQDAPTHRFGKRSK
jgi:ribonuclease R